jgi:uncharacterized membrane protein HdeD (DUF308 family)
VYLSFAEPSAAVQQASTLLIVLSRASHVVRAVSVMSLAQQKGWPHPMLLGKMSLAQSSAQQKRDMNLQGEIVHE